jgi:hypothetical protein
MTPFSTDEKVLLIDIIKKIINNVKTTSPGQKSATISLDIDEKVINNLLEIRFKICGK